MQRFANHFMRSPVELGEEQIREYLLHIVDHHNVNLPTYRAARQALSALYKGTLKRPEELKHIRGGPESLRQLAGTAHEPEEELPGDEAQTSAPAEAATKPRDPRLPPPGSVLERWHDGRAHRVVVLEEGFRYQGRIYSDPTGVVHKITRAPGRGLDFFALTTPWQERATQVRGRRLNRHTMIDLPVATEA